MPNTHLDAPLFIQEISETTVDVAQTPCFYNDGGTPTYLRELPVGVTPLTPATTDPALAVGNEYLVPSVLRQQSTPPYGIETQLGFAAEQVEFAPLWATREVAAAFGITLVEPGQGIRLTSPVATLQNIEYEYGVFAGHCRPTRTLATPCSARYAPTWSTTISRTSLPRPTPISRWWSPLAATGPG